jgi:hypothetical protein
MIDPHNCGLLPAALVATPSLRMQPVRLLVGAPSHLADGTGKAVMSLVGLSRFAAD